MPAHDIQVPFTNTYVTHLYDICKDIDVPPDEAIEWVTLFHKLGDDLFIRGPGDRTPLHLAAASNNVSVVRYILARRRSRQQRHPEDESGKTPLLLAKSAEIMNELPLGDQTRTVMQRQFVVVLTPRCNSSIALFTTPTSHDPSRCIHFFLRKKAATLLRKIKLKSVDGYISLPTIWSGVMIPWSDRY